MGSGLSLQETPRLRLAHEAQREARQGGHDCRTEQSMVISCQPPSVSPTGRSSSARPGDIDADRVAAGHREVMILRAPPMSRAMPIRSQTKKHQTAGILAWKSGCRHEGIFGPHCRSQAEVTADPTGDESDRSNRLKRRRRRFKLRRFNSHERLCLEGVAYCGAIRAPVLITGALHRKENR